VARRGKFYYPDVATLLSSPRLGNKLILIEVVAVLSPEPGYTEKFAVLDRLSIIVSHNYSGPPTGACWG
jgi:hypothetical protein